MLELYQFPHSAFCLKVRMALQAKNLNYKIINITPGIGQINIFRLSGQKQVPVLLDEKNIIFDSSKIVRHLDNKYLKNKLIPKDEQDATQVNLIEDWADTTLAKACRAELVKAASIDKELLLALLPNDMPSGIKTLAKSFSLEILNELTSFIHQDGSSNLLANLEAISSLVKKRKWIVGNSMSIADIAIAAQLSLLKFPLSSGLQLSGKGCKGFSDHPKLSSLFEWRDQFEIDLMKPDPVIR